MRIQGNKLNLALLAALVLPLLGAHTAVAQTANSRTFPETGKTVRGKFLDYWTNHGGLTQQGFPISNELQERSDTDGKTYTVQYFERAVFELHPENKAPNDVLLSLLGVFLYNQKYPNGAPNQSRSKEQGPVLFTVTGKYAGGAFLEYWRTHGGLAQQGFPISEEFQEKSDLDGKTYTVQYFERAVFEMHPENSPPFNVLLSQLGTFRYRAKYPQGGTTPQATARPTTTATPGGGLQQVQVTIREWAIAPNPLQLNAGKVRLTVNNDSPGMHNLTVISDQRGEVARTTTFTKGTGPKVLDVDLAPGTYKFICSLPGHEQAGQRATVQVK